MRVVVVVGGLFFPADVRCCVGIKPHNHRAHSHTHSLPYTSAVGAGVVCTRALVSTHTSVFVRARVINLNGPVFRGTSR